MPGTKGLTILDDINSKRASMRITEIIEAVAAATEVEPEKILGPTRRKEESEARFLAMKLIRHFKPGWSNSRIAESLKRSTPSSALLGIRRAEWMIANIPEFKAAESQAMEILALSNSMAGKTADRAQD
jgi:chromosomal replication initiation ATPase DnaA